MEGQKVVILRPGKEASHADYDPARKHLTTAAQPPENGKAMEERALAHVQLGAWLYRSQLYRLP